MAVALIAPGRADDDDVVVVGGGIWWWWRWWWWFTVYSRLPRCRNGRCCSSCFVVATSIWSEV